MIATFRNRNFSLLWLAGLISLMGNWILIAALPFHIYAVTGSALATSGWLMAYILPGVLFGSVAGVFVDRWDRRKIMIVVNLLQMGIIPLLLLAQSPEWIWIVYVVGFLESTLSQFFGPAESALLPLLVGEEHLLAANSLNTLNDNLARIIGPAVGGVILGIWGLQSVVFADALTYLLAALLIGMIGVGSAAKTAVKSKMVPSSSDIAPELSTSISLRAKFAAVWQEWRNGLRVVAQNRALINIFVVAGVALFSDAITSAVFVVFVQRNAGLGSTEFGWILTARGVGGVLGGILLAQVGKKLSNRQLASWGLIVVGVLSLGMLVKPTVIVLVTLTGLLGLPSVAWFAAMRTQMQQATVNEYRGRVFGAFGTTASLIMLISSGLAGATADWVGALTLLLIAGIISIVAGVLAWILFAESVEKMVVETAVTP